MPTMPLAEVKARLSELVGRVQAHHERVMVTVHGRPHRVGRRLLPPLDDRHSARRGSYRIIYRIDDKARTVTIVDVDHRRGVYRPH